MSAAGSIIGQCAECCECPTATVEWDSRSASAGKSGYVGLKNTPWRSSGDVDIPVKVYASATAAGEKITTQYLSGITDCTGTPFRRFWEGWDGSFSMDADGTCTGSIEVYNESALWPDPKPTPTYSYFTCDPASSIQGLPRYINGTYKRGQSLGAVVLSTLRDTSVADNGGTLDVASDSREWTGDGSCVDERSRTGSLSFTLSDEYTTALLKTNTVAALPAYDSDWNDTPGSFANLSTDELSYSIRESRYRLRFKIPKVGFGLCYKVTWVERFTPEGGGAVTDTPRCTIWDGATPGGYVPATPSTYPVLPSASLFYFELPVPTSDGTTTVENVVAECLRCTACP